jgi:hypothetical protein
MRLARLELARHSMLGTRLMPCARTDLSAACAVCSCREARGAAVRRSRRDQQRCDRHADGATRRRRIRRRRDGGRCSAMGAAGVKKEQPTLTFLHTLAPPCLAHAVALPVLAPPLSLGAGTGVACAGAGGGRRCASGAVRAGVTAVVGPAGVEGACGALWTRRCVNGGLAGLSPLASRHVHMSVNV